jgi:hypothetical protein
MTGIVLLFSFEGSRREVGGRSNRFGLQEQQMADATVTIPNKKKESVKLTADVRSP